MRIFLTILLLVAFSPTANAEEEFSFTFTWGDIPLCTSGKPNIVENPFFILEGVPQYTKIILFKMVDENVPNYKHGGGEVKYQGIRLIKPGAFTYKSPCPPDGKHTYTWNAYALDKDRKILATTSVSTRYPE